MVGVFCSGVGRHAGALGFQLRAHADSSSHVKGTQGETFQELKAEYGSPVTSQRGTMGPFSYEIENKLMTK